MDRYVFNHFYTLRHDKCRTIMFSPSHVSHDRHDESIDWVSYIHPVYAMLFSFFSTPVVLDEGINRISFFLDISKEQSKEIISVFIENKEEFHTIYSGHENNFPKNVIIPESKLKESMSIYKPEMFVYEKIDLKSVRLYTAPLHMTFMVNNKCLTNCIYCYADRKTRNSMLEFDCVERIIRDASKEKIRMFNVDGGEFFLYPYWKKLLETLEAYDYSPELLSTKYPLNRDAIQYLSRRNMPLQISFDSLVQGSLIKMVGDIPNYLERMKKSIYEINNNLPFQVATILTVYNGNVEGLNSLFDFLRQFDNLKRWELRVAFKSLYSPHNFEKIQISQSSISKIANWIDTIKEKSPFPIVWSPGNQNSFFSSKNGSADFPGSRCSANSTHMFVLPDGKVTICEQLYWNQNFLIGDLKYQTISEVWNSEKALYLADLPQDSFSKESFCHECKIFGKCQSFMNRCYANIMKAYGIEHWDYPDPRCVHAPNTISSNLYV